MNLCQLQLHYNVILVAQQIFLHPMRCYSGDPLELQIITCYATHTHCSRITGCKLNKNLKEFSFSIIFFLKLLMEYQQLEEVVIKVMLILLQQSVAQQAYAMYRQKRSQFKD